MSPRNDPDARGDQHAVPAQPVKPPSECSTCKGKGYLEAEDPVKGKLVVHCPECQPNDSPGG